MEHEKKSLREGGGVLRVEFLKGIAKRESREEKKGFN